MLTHAHHELIFRRAISYSDVFCAGSGHACGLLSRLVITADFGAFSLLIFLCHSTRPAAGRQNRMGSTHILNTLKAD